MRAAHSGEFFLIRLDAGEEILDCLQRWCEQRAIANAFVLGIGSVENPTLAHYRRDTKQFVEKRLAGIFEVTQVMGDVALVDGRPLVHAHVTLADSDMRAYGGHLVDGVCAATVELVIRPLPTKFMKDFDGAAGLKVWQFDDPMAPPNDERPQV